MIGVPITINDIRGKKVRVTLVKKENKMVPINEEGEEVNDPKMLNDFYEKIKIKINSEKIKNILPKKRLTVNIVEAFVNPIHIIVRKKKIKVVIHQNLIIGIKI